MYALAMVSAFCNYRIIDEVIARALGKVRVTGNYDAKNNNNEHFARWCKTGSAVPVR